MKLEPSLDKTPNTKLFSSSRTEQHLQNEDENKLTSTSISISEKSKIVDVLEGGVLVEDIDEEFMNESRTASDNLTIMAQPPDGGWGWAVVFASFMIHIIADGITYSFGIFVIEIMKEFGKSRKSVSLIPSILVGVTLGCGPIAGLLTNKYGCRLVTITGSMLAATGFAISSAATNIFTLQLCIGVCSGIGFGFIYLPAIVSVSMYFEKRRAFATGIAVCGSGIGTFLIAPATKMIIDIKGWRLALLANSCIILLVMLFACLFVPLKLTQSQKKPAKSEIKTIEKDQHEIGQLSQQIASDGDLHIEYHPEQQNPKIVVQKPQNTKVKNIKNSSMCYTLSHPSILNAQTASIRKARSNYGSYSKFYEELNHDITLQTHPNSPTFMERNHHHRHHHKHSHFHVANSGIMFRKDILYIGSLFNIPEYKNNPHRYSCQMSRQLFGHKLARNSMPTSSSLSNSFILNSKSISSASISLTSNASLSSLSSSCSNKSTSQRSFNNRLVSCCNLCISSSTYLALAQMLHLSILKNNLFIIFLISNIFTSIGFNVPYVYTVDRAVLIGLNDKDASYLLSIIGIANTFGRIVLGYFSDKAFLNRLYLYNTSLSICGISICLSNFCTTYTTQAIYCAVFGISSGAYVGLTSVVLVDMLGLDRLTNAFGILLLFQGLSSVIGPPITGWMYDVTQSFNTGFYFAGVMILLSGLILFSVPLVTAKKNRNINKVVYQG